jgi:cyclase
VLKPRFIPVLLLRGSGLYKTIKFRDPIYVGDPINAVRIFNEKAVDELIILDIDAHKSGKGPRLEILAEIASEAFIPLCYGGGVRSLSDFEALFRLGVEKVAVNSAVAQSMLLVEQAAKVFGNQSVVVSIDFRRTFLGRYRRYSSGGTVEVKGALEAVVRDAERAGAGYDLELLRQDCSAVNVPIVACGGAGSLSDMASAIREGGASAAAAGSLFVFKGRHRAVLITYPDEAQMDASLQT